MGKLLRYKKLGQSKDKELSCWGYAHGSVVRPDYGFEIKNKAGQVVQTTDHFLKALQVLEGIVELNATRHPVATINTVAGIAHFVKTEVENEQGRWNDNYATRDGYWVTHHGKYHDVYRV